MGGATTTNPLRAVKRAQNSRASVTGNLQARPSNTEQHQLQDGKEVRTDCGARLVADLPPSARGASERPADLPPMSGEASERPADLPSQLQQQSTLSALAGVVPLERGGVVGRHARQEAGADEASLSQRRRSHRLSVGQMAAMADLAEQRLQRKSSLAEGRSLDSRGRISFSGSTRRRSSAASRRSSAARRTSSAKG